MHFNKIIHLDELQDGDSWLVFSNHAFHGKNPDSDPSLKEIGRKFVKKCSGLPLALKSIGSLLYTKASYEEWNSIMTSEIWDMLDHESDILTALRLTYYCLPPNIKRCFAYCSLFPKGYEFDREHLVWLWIGENLLHCSQNSRSIKEVGYHYFYELISRSFFHYSRRNNKYFIMHDLVNDLAKYASREFCFMLEVEEPLPRAMSEKTRHFSFTSKGFINELASTQSKVVFKANKLRTLLHVNIFKDPHYIGKIYPKMLDDVLSKFHCLRVLSFCYFNITELPNSIGKLKHLRYLDLSCTRVIKLPDSICLLYNLQILKLRFCESLVELPSDLHELVNLQYLDIVGTKVRKMPMQLGKLKKLQVLTSFVVGKSHEVDFQQLAELQLGGELSILGLQNVLNPMDALDMNLKNKNHLDKLRLCWNIDNDESQKERKVLEKLQPHQNLKELFVEHYGGTRFPDWFREISLQNLVSLKLYNCKYCLLLPPLGLLPSLKTLCILGFDSMVNIGHEFYGDDFSTITFQSPELLEFENMMGWEDWECKDISDAFPVLQKLHIRNCPMLKQQLPEQLPSLRSLDIADCVQLMASVPHAIAIQELSLERCGMLMFKYIVSILEGLSISCSHMERSLLENFKHTIANSSLKMFRIDGSLNMEFPIHHLREFLIFISIYSSCESLETFPHNFFPKLEQIFDVQTYK